MHTTRSVIVCRLAVIITIATAIAVAGCSANSTAPPATISTGAAKTIVVIGDSIPFNSPSDCPGCTGFAESFTAALLAETDEPFELNNLSRHDSAKTADIVEQLEAGGIDSILSGASIVIVSAGFNDQPPYSTVGVPCAVESLDTEQEAIDGVIGVTPVCLDANTALSRANLAQILTQVRTLAPNAKILVLTSYNAWTGWPALDQSGKSSVVTPVIVDGLERWRVAVCEEAAAISATCIDLLEHFNGTEGAAAAGDLLAPDYTHPSQKGNDLIRDLLLATQN